MKISGVYIMRLKFDQSTKLTRAIIDAIVTESKIVESFFEGMICYSLNSVLSLPVLSNDRPPTSFAYCFHSPNSGASEYFSDFDSGLQIIIVPSVFGSITAVGESGSVMPVGHLNLYDCLVGELSVGSMIADFCNSIGDGCGFLSLDGIPAPPLSEDIDEPMLRRAFTAIFDNFYRGE